MADIATEFLSEAQKQNPKLFENLPRVTTTQAPELDTGDVFAGSVASVVGKAIRGVGQIGAELGGAALETASELSTAAFGEDLAAQTAKKLMSYAGESYAFRDRLDKPFVTELRTQAAIDTKYKELLNEGHHAAAFASKAGYEITKGLTQLGLMRGVGIAAIPGTAGASTTTLGVMRDYAFNALKMGVYQYLTTPDSEDRIRAAGYGTAGALTPALSSFMRTPAGAKVVDTALNVAVDYEQFKTILEEYSQRTGKHWSTSPELYVQAFMELLFAAGTKPYKTITTRAKIAKFLSGHEVEGKSTQPDDNVRLNSDLNTKVLNAVQGAVSALATDAEVKMRPAPEKGPIEKAVENPAIVEVPEGYRAESVSEGAATLWKELGGLGAREEIHLSPDRASQVDMLSKLYRAKRVADSSGDTRAVELVDEVLTKIAPPADPPKEAREGSQAPGKVEEAGSGLAPLENIGKPFLDAIKNRKEIIAQHEKTAQGDYEKAVAPNRPWQHAMANADAVWHVGYTGAKRALQRLLPKRFVKAFSGAALSRSEWEVIWKSSAREADKLANKLYLSAKEIQDFCVAAGVEPSTPSLRRSVLGMALAGGDPTKLFTNDPTIDIKQVQVIHADIMSTVGKRIESVRKALDETEQFAHASGWLGESKPSEGTYVGRQWEKKKGVAGFFSRYTNRFRQSREVWNHTRLSRTRRWAVVDESKKPGEKIVADFDPTPEGYRLGEEELAKRRAQFVNQLVRKKGMSSADAKKKAAETISFRPPLTDFDFYTKDAMSIPLRVFESYSRSIQGARLFDFLNNYAEIGRGEFWSDGPGMKNAEGEAYVPFSTLSLDKKRLDTLGLDQKQLNNPRNRHIKDMMNGYVDPVFLNDLRTVLQPGGLLFEINKAYMNLLGPVDKAQKALITYLGPRNLPIIGKNNLENLFLITMFHPKMLKDKTFAAAWAEGQKYAVAGIEPTSAGWKEFSTLPFMHESFLYSESESVGGMQAMLLKRRQPGFHPITAARAHYGLSDVAYKYAAYSYFRNKGMKTGKAVEEVDGMFFNYRDLPPWVRNAQFEAFWPSVLYNFTRIFNYQLENHGASLLTRAALFGMAKYFSAMGAEELAGVADEEREILKKADRMPSRLFDILLPFRGKDGRLLSFSIRGFIPYLNELRFVTGATAGDSKLQSAVTALTPVTLQPFARTVMGIDRFGRDTSSQTGVFEQGKWLDFAENSLSMGGPVLSMITNIYHEQSKKAEKRKPALYNLLGAAGWRLNDILPEEVGEIETGKLVGEHRKVERSMIKTAFMGSRGQIKEEKERALLGKGDKQLDAIEAQLRAWQERMDKLEKSKKGSAR